MKKYNSRARKLDLSAKFLKMGQSLQIEGDLNDDVDISMLGTNLIFLGSLALSDEDLYKFSELVSMFTAKKTIDDLLENNDEFIKIFKNHTEKNTYDKIIGDLEKTKEEEEEENDED